MDRELAEAVLAEKQRREAWAAEVRAILDIDHEVSHHRFDRTRVNAIQELVASRLGLEVQDGRVRRKIEQALLSLGLSRVRVNGRPFYRGVRRLPGH